MESIICNKLRLNQTVYDARKLYVGKISKNQSKEFLNKYHLYGNSVSDVCYGLKDESGNIISVMTFKEHDKYGWELKRLANKTYCNVRGSVSRLLNHFIRDYNPKSIMSYSDKRFSQGNVYTQIGFEFIEDTKPTEWFFKIVGTLPDLKRINWRTIVRQYKGTNTRYQAFQDGWYTIYDCGHAKWLWESMV